MLLPLPRLSSAAFRVSLVFRLTNGRYEVTAGVQPEKKTPIGPSFMCVKVLWCHGFWKGCAASVWQIGRPSPRLEGLNIQSRNLTHGNDGHNHWPRLQSSRTHPTPKLNSYSFLHQMQSSSPLQLPVLELCSNLDEAEASICRVPSKPSPVSQASWPQLSPGFYTCCPMWLYSISVMTLISHLYGLSFWGQACLQNPVEIMTTIRTLELGFQMLA